MSDRATHTFERGQRVVVRDGAECALAPPREGGWAGKNGHVLQVDGDKVLVHTGLIYQWMWFYAHELEVV